MFPIKLEIRKHPMLPIVEVKAISEKNFNVDAWIVYPLSVMELGIFMKGRLLPEEPKETLKANTVYFVLIFETEQKANEFITILQ